MEVLRLENLSKYYTSSSSVVMGLSSINLSFSVGEFVAITGESGSGKSTLAHVLGGIMPYEAGELYIYGKPTSHYDASDWGTYRRDMVGFISQNYGILAGNTVLENVESALRLSGIDKKDARARAEEILREVELFELKSRRAGKLSSGQKQRLSIARALAKPSKILIADEPTGNLDRENSEKVISLLKKASEDRLVILITHEFDEAKEVATRRIILSDGIVVTDAKLQERPVCEEETKDTGKKAEAKKKKAKGKSLVSYVAGLTLKARPMFSAIMCLLLAFTSFITFALLGTFIVALDDSSTRIYDSDAFLNGDSDRIVVMKSDGTRFGEDDYRDVLSVRYVEELEPWGYTSDVSYYYRPDTDYYLQKDVVNGPNYHPVLNPEDFQVTEVVKFIETGLYFQTVPMVEGGLEYRGSLPVGAYEVLSADPNYKIGDKLTVFIRNKNDWSISSSIHMQFTVVGETDRGSGLYFSDKLAAALSNFSKVGDDGKAIYLNGEKVIIAPYDPDSFNVTKYWKENEGAVTDTTGSSMIIVPSTGLDLAGGVAEIPVDGVIELGENEICMSEFLASRSYLKLGRFSAIGNMDVEEHITVEGFIDAQYTRLVLVSERVFDSLNDVTPDNQVSIYIKDYAYADRVMDQLEDKGYIAVSPFRLGATFIDPQLASERMTTLGVCLGALILIIILQLILLKAMFSSLNEHFRLMSNIGLTAKTAYASLSLILIFFGVVGELLGASAVALLNGLGVQRIVSIFKFLEADNIAALFAVHIVSVCFSFVSVVGAMKKNVFANVKRTSDIDLSEVEEA